MTRTTLYPASQDGYIALMAVLVVGAASTAIALGILLTGTDSQRATLVRQQSIQARNVVSGCIEEALMVIQASNSYTGSNSLSLGQGSCTYTVTSTGLLTRTVTASATINTTTRRATATITIGTTTIAVNSWQEVSDF